MNERIKELAEQASEIMENTESQVVIARFGSNPSLQDLEDLWNEKFAELIVAECASIGNKAWKEDGEYTYIGDKIKQHFGVE